MDREPRLTEKSREVGYRSSSERSVTHALVLVSAGVHAACPESAHRGPHTLLSPGVHMRRLLYVLLPVALITAAGFAGRDSEVRDPRFANIVATCGPIAEPAVVPPRVFMSRADSVVWRVTGGRATSWTITPKDEDDWLFDQTSFTGTPESPAVTRRPRAEALPDHPYAYEVRITCPDGTTQLIDPDIVIGEAQDF